MQGAAPTRRSAKLSLLRQPSRAERYTIAITTAALAVLFRWFLDPVLGHVAFYVTVYTAVAFCAIVWPGTRCVECPRWLFGNLVLVH
jgi:hypothetical protein